MVSLSLSLSLMFAVYLVDNNSPLMHFLGVCSASVWESPHWSCPNQLVGMAWFCQLWPAQFTNANLEVFCTGLNVDEGPSFHPTPGICC